LINDLRKSKIRDLRFQIVIQKNIIRPQVSVDNSALVQHHHPDRSPIKRNKLSSLIPFRWRFLAFFCSNHGLQTTLGHEFSQNRWRIFPIQWNPTAEAKQSLVTDPR
jgi:hypothetical protein